MKEPEVIILVKEREKRVPKKNVVYIPECGCNAGDIEVATHDHDEPRVCYQRHDIDVPEGAKELTVQVSGCPQSPPAVHIPLPQHPAPRFKWQYRMTIYGKNVTITLDELTTEEEARQWRHDVTLEKVPT